MDEYEIKDRNHLTNNKNKAITQFQFLKKKIKIYKIKVDYFFKIRIIKPQTKRFS
jgi:hypothetical protein